MPNPKQPRSAVPIAVLYKNPWGVEQLIRLTGFNMSQLAADMSVYAGRKIHRQLLLRWRQGGGMQEQTVELLKAYKENYERLKALKVAAAKRAAEKRKKKRDLQSAAKKAKARKG